MLKWEQDWCFVTCAHRSHGLLRYILSYHSHTVDFEHVIIVSRNKISHERTTNNNMVKKQVY